MSTIFAVGANSVVARTVLPLLRNYTIITGGRHGCDVYCDLNERVAIPSGVDVVLNFAASFGGESDGEIVDAARTNTLGILRLCEAANDAGVARIIHFSSVYAQLAEADPQFSIYALTKRQGDELAVFYCSRKGLPLTILRPSRLYGDTWEFASGQPFLYRVIERASRRETVDIYGTNDARRNYLHCADLANIISCTIDQGVDGVFTCIYPKDVTCSEVAKIAIGEFDGKSSVQYLKNKPNIADDNYPRDMELYGKIGLWPTIDIHEGIRRIKESLREEG